MRHLIQTMGHIWNKEPTRGRLFQRAGARLS